MKKALNISISLVFSIGLLVGTQSFADPTTLPLIHSGDFAYLGAFALPLGSYGDSRFGYSGEAITPFNDPSTGQHTLFIGGHAWDPGTVAQIEIPSTFVQSADWSALPQAHVLQNFYDIADGRWASLGTTDYVSVYGMLPYNDRLIVGAASWYDASCSQTASHGVSGFDLSLNDDFQGFVTIDAAADPRSIGGYMTTIPGQWQGLLGGPALAGNAAMSIIGCISSGPAATVFDPDQLGARNPIPGTTIVYYPLSHYLVSGGVTTQNTFTFGSTVKGIAFPAGTRSLLFIGRHTMADRYCYGPGTDDPDLHLEETEGGTWCYDPCNHSKGGHGYPYYHYVWAYDANDLVKVKEGEMEPWEAQPYDAWRLDDMNSSGCATIRGAGYDPDTQRLFITQAYGEEPRVEVYRINSPSGATDSTGSTDASGPSPAESAASGGSSGGCFLETIFSDPIACRLIF